MPLATLGVALILGNEPQPFHGLTTIGKIVYLVGVVQFIILTVFVLENSHRASMVSKISIHPFGGFIICDYLAVIWQHSFWRTPPRSTSRRQSSSNSNGCLLLGLCRNRIHPFHCPWSTALHGKGASYAPKHDSGLNASSFSYYFVRNNRKYCQYRHWASSCRSDPSWWSDVSRTWDLDVFTCLGNILASFISSRSPRSTSSACYVPRCRSTGFYINLDDWAFQ